jgi:hypothetical protein
MVGELVGNSVGELVGVMVGPAVGAGIVGSSDVGNSVAEVGKKVVPPIVGLNVVTSTVGVKLGGAEIDGAPVVGDTVGPGVAFGSTVGPSVGTPVGTASKGHVSSSAATRHSPLHAPPTKQPEFSPSLKRRLPPLAQRKLDSVSGLIKFILAIKSEPLSTKITNSPLPPWKQVSVIFKSDRKSIRIGACSDDNNRDC